MNVINLIDGTSVIFSKNNGAVHLRKDLYITKENMNKGKWNYEKWKEAKNITKKRKKKAFRLSYF